MKIVALLLSLLIGTTAQAGDFTTGSPYTLGGNTTAMSIGQAPLLYEFGARCDGTTDDSAAFAAAMTYLSTAPNRTVMLPAATCATSTTVTMGNGRQQNTTLTANALVNATSLTVASIAGIQNGDSLVILLDNSTTYTTQVSGAPSGNTVNITGTLPSQASTGAVVYSGLYSTYQGAALIGAGPGATAGEFGGVGHNPISTIKYIGAAAATTTLGATAAANATSLTVASTANMSLGTPLGITLDNGRVWWTTINAITSATVVTLMNEVPSQATLGNTVTIANNPVLKVAGGIYAAKVQGIRLDANSLAAIGVDLQHPVHSYFKGNGGLQVVNYTGIGAYIHATRAYLGTVIGVGDNDFEIFAQNPANTHTIGVFAEGYGNTSGNSGIATAFSRNRFWGGIWTMGGADVTAAAFRAEFIDNNIFYKTYTIPNGGNNAGAYVYREPSHFRTGFPGANLWFGLITNNGTNGVFNGTDVGGAVTGSDYFERFDTSDGATFPYIPSYGTDDLGNIYANGIRSKNVIVTKTSAYPIVVADTGTHFDNNGAGGSVALTLPVAASGLKYCFQVVAAQNIVVTANTGDKIAIGGTNSAATGNITSNVVNSNVCLESHAAGQWAATSVVGTWTVN